MQDPAECPESLKKLRTALLSYLKITLNLLPAESDIWKQQLESSLPITPKDLKGCLSDSDVFGARDSVFVLRFKRWAEWPGPMRPTGLEFQDVRMLDLSHGKPYEILRNLLCGEYSVSEIVDISVAWDRYYGPRLDHLSASAKAGTRIIESHEMFHIEAFPRDFAESLGNAAMAYGLRLCSGGCINDKEERRTEELIHNALSVMIILDGIFEKYGVSAVPADLGSERHQKPRD